MKIELKKIYFSERMSEETNCFAADLYINGKKVGYVKNDGQGGCTDYHGYTKEDNEIIRKAEEYCKTLPDVTSHGYVLKQNLELVIDTLFEEHIIAKLKAKEEKKMQKLFQTAIVFGKPNAPQYRYMNFKQPLSSIPMSKLVFYVAKVVSDHCRDGVQLLNTNFKFENGKVIFV